MSYLIRQRKYVYIRSYTFHDTYFRLYGAYSVSTYYIITRNSSQNGDIRSIKELLLHRAASKATET